MMTWIHPVVFKVYLHRYFCNDLFHNNSNSIHVDTGESLLKRVINKIIEDNSFKVSSTTAAEVLETAESIIEWVGHGPPFPAIFQQFSDYLSKRLQTCFKSNKNLQRERELMWGQYHLIRCSTDFHNTWQKFVVNAIGVMPSPSFYQFVTYEFFKAEITKTYSSDDTRPDAVTPVNNNLTNIEENALRYVAGYVCRKLRFKLETSSNPLKAK